MDYQMLGKRVRLKRKRMQLTQEQLAERIDRTASFVGHMSGEREK